MSTNSSYVCDTIPAARLANDPQVPSEPVFDDPEPTPMIESDPQQSPPRKLCVRHQRMADEGTNLKLQQVLELSFSFVFSN